MKLLLVSGENDYAASSFEEMMTVPEAVKILEDGSEWIDEEEGITGKIFEFGEVDPKFIGFVRDRVQDYDDAKHYNFYIIE